MLRKSVLIPLLLLYGCSCLAQKNDSIIYFPLKKDQIEFQGRVLRMLKHNHVSRDSAKALIHMLESAKLKRTFGNCISPTHKSRYRDLSDSNIVARQWTTTQARKIAESTGVSQMLNAHDDIDRNKYDGLTLSDYQLDQLKLLMQETGSPYTFCFNKFRIVDAGPFSGESRFILHLEVYDKNANKIFGDKFESRHSLSGKLSYSLFSYFTGEALVSFYTQLKQKINQ